MEILLKYIDAITMTVAFIAVGLSAAVRAYRGDPTSRGKVIIDLLNGTAIVPFSILAMCVFSDSLLKELTEHDKLILSTAGAMGLVFVIEILQLPRAFWAKSFVIYGQIHCFEEFRLFPTCR
jgi:peptidoglycan/LPS O-acetylase OafA/YrhL